MLQFIKRFVDFNEKQLHSYRVLVDQINKLEDEVRDLKDSDFKAKTQEMKEQVASGEKTLNDLRYAPL